MKFQENLKIKKPGKPEQNKIARKIKKLKKWGKLRKPENRTTSKQPRLLGKRR
jgi:hypothetical protein